MTAPQREHLTRVCIICSLFVLGAASMGGVLYAVALWWGR